MKYPFNDLKPSVQAGILCNDWTFRRFLNTKNGAVTDISAAARYVRLHCLVVSRSYIRNGHVSGRLWRELVAEYRNWQTQ